MDYWQGTARNGAGRAAGRTWRTSISNNDCLAPAPPKGLRIDYFTVNRRSFLNVALAGAAPAKARPQPNVLFILVDQWRAQAFGYSGDPNARTPSIDALAGESVSFRNAVSGFPVCSPYRASLLTGQYAVRNGLVVNDVPLRPNGPTLGESFRKAGYETAYIGKWHVHGSPDGKFGRRLAYIPKESRFGFEYWKASESALTTTTSLCTTKETIRRNKALLGRLRRSGPNG